MKNEIWIICETKEKEITHASYELISKAKQLALKNDAAVAAVILSETGEKETIMLHSYGADKAYRYLCDNTIEYTEDAYAEIASHYARAINPEIILTPATLSGRSLAPKIAMALKTGLTADCTGLDIDENGSLIQTRPAYGGNIIAEITCDKRRPQMATVRPGVFQAQEPENKKALACEIIYWDFRPENIKNIEIIERIIKKSEGMPVETAKVIVAGGMGSGGSEGLRKLDKLAGLLGGTTAASRAAVNAGYAPYEKQVGQTGKTIRPKLYIACGISGAVQHLAGMSSSDFIIAINSDPKAPIFDICDYGIVGEVDEIIDYLIDYFSNTDINSNILKE